jgi:RNA-directed DNA polymerase
MEIASKSEWGAIDWGKTESVVSKLQRRIFRASKDGNIDLVHKLQKLLLKSLSAKLIAVRKVTQENKGKNTAGIDGVAKVTPEKRMEMALKLEINGKSKPTRRVYVPKREGNEKRGLGIPTIEERCKQALLKLARVSTRTELPRRNRSGENSDSV